MLAGVFCAGDFLYICTKQTYGFDDGFVEKYGGGFYQWLSLYPGS